ncbi:MAG TPA: SRPBCC family protein [Bauldia sp.]|nr:SRPBCC family protein [Bauldia sp.]
MNIQINPAPVRKSVTVKAKPERAFDIFTAGMTTWWLPDHHIGQVPLKEIVAEPRPGGRWYEVGEDGSICEWGKVLVWDRPNRVVFAWQLNAAWKYDPDFVTELEVRFVPEAAGTRVELEHRNLDRYGADAAEIRRMIDSEGGWPTALVAFAAAANA